MITELTEAQKVRLEEYREEYFAIGSCTDVADYERARKAIFEMYEVVNQNTPPNWVFGTPAECLRAIHIVKESETIRARVREIYQERGWTYSVQDPAPGQVEHGALLLAVLGETLYNLLGKPGLLFEQGVGELFELTKKALYTNLSSSISTALGQAFWGQHEAYWIAFYRFCNEIGVPYDELRTKQLALWDEVAKSAGWWWPYEYWLFVADRPSAINWNNNERPQLHCTTGPSVAYRDGWKVYHLNGIRVPDELIETPVDELDYVEWIGNTNVEVRAQFVALVGPEKLLAHLDGVLLEAYTYPEYMVNDYDAEGNIIGQYVAGPHEYELWEIDLGPNVGRNPILKMKNPSEDRWHYEFVEPACRTVQQALEMRNRRAGFPQQLT